MLKPWICWAFLVAMCPLATGCASLGALSPLRPLEVATIFQPARFPDGNWNPDGLAVEDAWFESSDGTPLHGWYVPHETPQAVVLFFHGNAGNITSRASFLDVLNRRHKLSVMTFDYRGYGRSEGSPSEQGILQDARAARTWLADRAGVEEQDIVLMGRSLGGAIAVDLAAADGARGLVLASTFTSLPDVAHHHIPWLPTRLMMTQRLDSHRKLKNYRGPLLQSHGDADEVVPYEQGRRLFEQATGPKQFVTISGGDHNGPLTEEFHQAMDEFLIALPDDGMPASPPQAKPARSSSLRS